MKFIFLLAFLFHDVGLGTKSFRQISHLIGNDGVGGLERGAFRDPCLLPKDFRCLAHFPSTTAGGRRSIGEIALAMMFVFCSYDPSSEVGIKGGPHGSRETARTDQALESDAACRRPAGRGNPYSDPGGLCGA